MGWYHGMTPEQMEATFGETGASCSIDNRQPVQQQSSPTSTTTTTSASSSSSATVIPDDEGIGGTISKSGNTACPLPPSSPPPPPPPDVRYIYHLCQKSKWEDAVTKKEPYFPPTYMIDGKFTRASVYKDDIVDVANEFYKTTPGEFCVLEIDCKMLYNLGIPIMAQQAPESTAKKVVKCLQIFGGISTTAPNLVHKVYPIHRRSMDGSFVKILEPSNQAKYAEVKVADGDKSKPIVSSRNENNPEQALPAGDASNTKFKFLFGRTKKVRETKR